MVDALKVSLWYGVASTGPQVWSGVASLRVFPFLCSVYYGLFFLFSFFNKFPVPIFPFLYFESSIHNGHYYDVRGGVSLFYISHFLLFFLLGSVECLMGLVFVK